MALEDPPNEDPSERVNASPSAIGERAATSSADAVFLTMAVEDWLATAKTYAL